MVFRNPTACHRQRKRIAACVRGGMWRPFTKTASDIGPQKMPYGRTNFTLQHANKAIDAVRGQEFFRKGGTYGGVVKGKRWVLLTAPWMNRTAQNASS